MCHLMVSSGAAPWFWPTAGLRSGLGDPDFALRITEPKGIKQAEWDLREAIPQELQTGRLVAVCVYTRFGFLATVVDNSSS